MKLLAKTLLAGGGLALASTASAASINLSISFDPNAEANFKDLLKPGYVAEDFDSLPQQGSGPQSFNGGSASQNDQASWVDSNPTFNTNVGTFTLEEAGQVFATSGGFDDGDGNELVSETDGDNLKIESEDTGEFGREALSDYQGDFWLDSNDAKQVNWKFDSGAVYGKSFNAFGFYIADPADIQAQLKLKFENGTESDAFTIPFGQDNANVGFVSVTSDVGVSGGTLYFNNSEPNDGWGIDDVTVGRLPEPGTLLLMGLGLLGLGAARRRAAK